MGLFVDPIDCSGGGGSFERPDRAGEVRWRRFVPRISKLGSFMKSGDIGDRFGQEMKNRSKSIGLTHPAQETLVLNRLSSDM